MGAKQSRCVNSLPPLVLAARQGFYKVHKEYSSQWRQFKKWTSFKIGIPANEFDSKVLNVRASSRSSFLPGFVFLELQCLDSESKTNPIQPTPFHQAMSNYICNMQVMQVNAA